MFRYLCSYQEVSPNFLKLVHSLGDQMKDRKFHDVGFFEEYLMKSSKGSNFDLPEIGRSGSEFRNFYQLQAMEFSSVAEDGWVRRQTTVFHSFDLETTRSFWLTIKADDKIKERILESQGSRTELQPESLRELPGSFNASMLTHLTHLEWCTEGWRLAIDAKEVRLRDIVEKAQAAPIVPLSLQKTLPTSQKENHGQDEAAIAFEQCQIQTKNLLKHEQVLKEVSVFRFQDLTSYTLWLQEAKLAMALNIDILGSIGRSYQSFFESAECPEEIRRHCSANIRNFLRRVQSLETELGMECKRANTLINQLQEAKPLVCRACPF